VATQPPISEQLLEYLRHVFPDRCPDENTPDRKVWMNAGAASVVRHLERLRNEQLESSLT
jgi:hypothetical protein